MLGFYPKTTIFKSSATLYGSRRSMLTQSGTVFAVLIIQLFDHDMTNIKFNNLSACKAGAGL